MCGGRRVALLTMCPSKCTPDEVWEMIELVDLADVDLPVPGGWLGQTACFKECFNLVRAETAKCKAAVTKGAASR